MQGLRGECVRRIECPTGAASRVFARIKSLDTATFQTALALGGERAGEEEEVVVVEEKREVHGAPWTRLRNGPCNVARCGARTK